MPLVALRCIEPARGHAVLMVLAMPVTHSWVAVVSTAVLQPASRVFTQQLLLVAIKLCMECQRRLQTLLEQGIALGLARPQLGHLCRQVCLGLCWRRGGVGMGRTCFHGVFESLPGRLLGRL